jgi:hypothetical protein
LLCLVLPLLAIFRKLRQGILNSLLTISFFF